MFSMWACLSFSEIQGQFGVALGDGVGDAADGDVEIFGVELDSDKRPAFLDGCDAGCAAAHERVKDGIARVRIISDNPKHDA